MYVYIYIYIYICVCMYVCIYVCVCVWCWVGGCRGVRAVDCMRVLTIVFSSVEDRPTLTIFFLDRCSIMFNYIGKIMLAPQEPTRTEDYEPMKSFLSLVSFSKNALLPGIRELMNTVLSIKPSNQTSRCRHRAESVGDYMGHVVSTLDP